MGISGVVELVEKEDVEEGGMSKGRRWSKRPHVKNDGLPRTQLQNIFKALEELEVNSVGGMKK